MTLSKTEQDTITWLDQHQAQFIDMADQIWRSPELAWKEFKAARLQADYLEKEGFSIRWEVGGIKTAFIAEWGQGKPILGFIGEYDALPGLSQKLQATQEPVKEGDPGHGCGHNLLGTGAVASAAAVKHWLQLKAQPGTVRYYGCPAEEEGGGKVFMAQSGVFNDLEAAFNFHPSKVNMASKGVAVGIQAIYYRFKGRTAHAGGAPHEGRSALDAVELMNIGVNYLREHVKNDVRMHYIITEGGKAPNIVPEMAEVYYYLRAAKPDTLAAVIERVHKVAQGAAMMTETTCEPRYEIGYYPLLNNHYLADLQYQAMQAIGPIQFTPEEIEFAQKVNDGFPGTNAEHIDGLIDFYKPPAEIRSALEQYRDLPLVGDNFPATDENVITTGSTDVGDLSQVAPVSMLGTACFSTGCPGHSWGNVAAAGMSIGHKGMLHAAKIMALAAVELFSDPAHLVQIRQEFERVTKNKSYVPAIPENLKPPRYDAE